MVVDDEPELRATLCETLNDIGYATVGCASGAEALQVLQTQDFDLLLTDLMMPGMDGIELLRSGLALDPHLVGIVMTGHGTVQTAVEAMKLGAFDYVLKPFKLQAVMPVITRGMELRRLRMENVQLRETVAIHELTQALALTVDLGTILNKAADAAVQQGADEVSIMLLDPGVGDQFTIAVVRGRAREHLVGARIPINEGIAGWVARQREPLTLRGMVNDPRFAPSRPRWDIVSAVSIPMLAGGKFVGVFNVNATNARRPFTLGQVKALSLLAGTTAIAIDNSLLFASLDRARKDAEEANRLKDEFLAVVSHELRTPLTSILGWAQVLRDCPHDETSFRRGMEVIVNNVKSQGQLIDNLLDVSSIVTGKLSLGAEPIDLRQIVSVVIDGVEPAVQAKHLQLRIVLDPEPALVLGDAHRMQQVVSNLVSNAVKFTPQGGQIDVSLTCFETSVELVVGDNGQGISPEFLPYVFDRFRQADSSNTRRHGGMGLGLSIARNLAELQGGTIAAQSDGEGKGARFTLRLPPAPQVLKEEDLLPAPDQGGDDNAPAAHPCDGAEADATFSPPGALGDLLILVIEDDWDSRELIEILLEREGAEVKAVGSGSQALACLETWSPSVLVCDIGLPEEDGYEFLARLRALPGRPAPPAIALTAYTRGEDRERALAAGFRAHLSKPIDPGELVATIRAVVDNQAVGTGPAAEAVPEGAVQG